MNTTTMNTRPKLSGTCVVLLLISATPLIQGFQLQQQQQRTRAAKTTTTMPVLPSSPSSSSSSLSVGAAPDYDYNDYDYFQEDNTNFAASADIGIEAAIGNSASANSQYEQDAEFYKQRNEAYYNSIYKEDDEDDDNEIIVKMLHQGTVDVGDSSSSSSSNAATTTTNANANTNVFSMINTSLKASHTSFKNVEEFTNSLLKGKPLLAIAIFALAGVAVAYMSGFFLLDGYSQDWNPFVQNDNMVPYWDDAEIHTIQRAVLSSKQ